MICFWATLYNSDYSQKSLGCLNSFALQANYFLASLGCSESSGSLKLDELSLDLRVCGYLD